MVVDGGLSTQLARLGQDTSGLLWTGRVLLDNPAAITRAHADYVDAGADVVITRELSGLAPGVRARPG